MKLEEITLWRSSSRKMLSHHVRTSSSSSSSSFATAAMQDGDKIYSPTNTNSINSTLLVLSNNNTKKKKTTTTVGSTRILMMMSSLLESLISSIFSFPRSVGIMSSSSSSCRWLTNGVGAGAGGGPVPSSLGRKVTVTLFGHRKGHVTLAVQDHPRSEPVLLMELPTSTTSLVKEMSSGLLRIALECQHNNNTRRRLKLYKEPLWSMYCNGNNCGYAMPRSCSPFDLHLLNTVQTVSVGAGVIPLHLPSPSSNHHLGELVFMRARFDRVVSTRHSEAFYMLNPDSNYDAAPELSIFLLRL